MTTSRSVNGQGSVAGDDSMLLLRREALKLANERLAQRFHAGVPAGQLLQERAATVDEVLSGAWAHYGLSQQGMIALVAVGGYGRSELHPASDVDVLLLVTEPGHDPIGANASPHPHKSSTAPAQSIISPAPGNPSAARPATDHDPIDHNSKPADPLVVDTENIQQFIAFLWDVGLEVGHSVRTVDQCREQARRDITVFTNLMEARLVAGEPQLLEELQGAISAADLWPSPQFFDGKRREQRARHLRFDDTAYKLEPNVKEGPGGLRDIQTVAWVAKRHFGADTLAGLVRHDFITQHEFEALREGQDFLWQVRFALHLLTGRREDRLLFDHQRALARAFGYQDDDANLAVEKFMKQYYRNIMELSRLNEMLLELFQEAIVLADAAIEVRVINRRFQSVNGFLEARHDQVFSRYPFALLEIFLILQQHPELEGVRATTIRLIRDHRHLIDEGFRNDLRHRALFLEILKQPRGILHELRRMHRYGVLAAYLPAFGAVVGQMQYDLFHTYTVDEHSLFVVRNLRAMATGKEFPALCLKLYSELPKPHLIYLAALFHDIAKGRGGDHSELGADYALEFCLHHGLSQHDAEFVSWLVRHHLLMSVTAQRKDITDPQVVKAFAQQVADRHHLSYLYLLTVADIAGTNPTLWNDWKDTLLRDLYESTVTALRRGLDNPIDKGELIAQTQESARKLLGEKPHRDGNGDIAETLWDRLADDYFLRHTPDEIAWHSDGILDHDRRRPRDHGRRPLVLVRQGRGGIEIFVYARDREFLFAAITSALGRLGFTILDARIITAANGMTLDSFIGHPVDDGQFDGSDLDQAVAQAIEGALREPERSRRGDSRLTPRQLRHFPIPTEVSFHHDEHNERTVMEIVANDRPGLLADVGWALADLKIRLQSAKITTFGERAEDVFFITDVSNAPLASDRLEVVADTVRRAIERVG